MFVIDVAATSPNKLKWESICTNILSAIHEYPECYSPAFYTMPVYAIVLKRIWTHGLETSMMSGRPYVASQAVCPPVRLSVRQPGIARMGPRACNCKAEYGDRKAYTSLTIRDKTLWFPNRFQIWFRNISQITSESSETTPKCGTSLSWDGCQ